MCFSRLIDKSFSFHTLKLGSHMECPFSFQNAGTFSASLITISLEPRTEPVIRRVLSKYLWSEQKCWNLLSSFHWWRSHVTFRGRATPGLCFPQCLQPMMSPLTVSCLYHILWHLIFSGCILLPVFCMFCSSPPNPPKNIGCWWQRICIYAVLFENFLVHPVW